MSFLNRFPKRWFTINGKPELLTNISRRVIIPDSVKSQPGLYMMHHLQSGDRPDIISQRLYDTPAYWWLVLMINDIIDVDKQWPLSDHDLEDYIDATYADPYETRHYVDADGDVVDPRAVMWQTGAADIASVVSIYNLRAVTHHEYEEQINEAKRYIKLIDPAHIVQFDDYLEEALNE